MNAITASMAEARSNVRIMADASAEILRLERRNAALLVALNVIENDLRLSRCVALHVSALNTLVAARDDDRMGWSER